MFGRILNTPLGGSHHSRIQTPMFPPQQKLRKLYISIITYTCCKLSTTPQLENPYLTFPGDFPSFTASIRFDLAKCNSPFYGHTALTTILLSQPQSYCHFFQVLCFEFCNIFKNISRWLPYRNATNKFLIQNMEDCNIW